MPALGLGQGQVEGSGQREKQRGKRVWNRVLERERNKGRRGRANYSSHLNANNKHWRISQLAGQQLLLVAI